MGQILSEQGQQEEAIDCLIDALRWDSKNGWALLMMGNIFAKYKNDVETAIKYYDQALVVNPTDVISINNIGANLLQQGKIKEAKKYFHQALETNKSYPNTYFALGMAAEQEGNYAAAFENTLLAIQYNPNKDGLYQNSLRLAVNAAQKICATDIGKAIFTEYRHKLEWEGDKRVEVIQDDTIPTAAKFELAENYKRENHVIRYKTAYPAVEHLMMHELVHLDFVIQARKENLNQLFISNQQHKQDFIKNLEPTIKKFGKMGIPEQSIADYCNSLFEGINRQIFNTPIDLFIENFLFHAFPTFRPFQFLSLYALLQEGKQAVTDKRIVEMSPKDILSKSKVLNLVNAIQFRELFGIDTLKDFQALPSELKLATDFYAEYQQYKDDKAPAEEYELVLHWAEDLKLEKNFELADEQEYRNKRTNIDSLLQSIEQDPYDLETNDPRKEKEFKKFQESQKSIGTNPAVVSYMVDALRFFEKLPKEEIKKIAFEIAMQGTQGYDPNKDGYLISSIKGKTFSGYHILAYYYVSWALAIPEMLAELPLPYEEEYKLACAMSQNA